MDKLELLDGLAEKAVEAGNSLYNKNVKKYGTELRKVLQEIVVLCKEERKKALEYQKAIPPKVKKSDATVEEEDDAEDDDDGEDEEEVEVKEVKEEKNQTKKKTKLLNQPKQLNQLKLQKPNQPKKRSKPLLRKSKLRFNYIGNLFINKVLQR